MIRRSVAWASGSLAALATTCSLFVACSDDPAPASAPAPIAEASASDVVDLPSEAAIEDAGAADVEDELIIPDAGVECDGDPCATAISGAGGAFCARLRDGTIACWGNNDHGQLGYDSGPDFPPASGSARAVAALAGATHVSVGESNACARLADSGVVCWGASPLLAAGLTPDAGAAPDADFVTSPVAQAAVPAATDIAVGSGVACVIGAGGSLSCWGDGTFGALGGGTLTAQSSAPAPAQTGANPIVTARVAARGFAIDSTGTLLSWGTSTQNGESGFLLGRETSEDPDPVPAAVPIANVRGVATAVTHGCAIEGRDVQCWGSNDQGQLGRGTFGSTFFLPAPSTLRYVVGGEDHDAGILHSNDVPLAIAAGDSTTCGVMGSGRVYCWGANGSGQIGANGASDIIDRPQRIPDLAGPAVSVAVGGGAACALLRSGAVQCWGANYHGQIATGTFDDGAHPHPNLVTLPH